MVFGLVRTPLPIELGEQEEQGYIRVTRKDMKNGIPGDTSECAIAQTLHRIYPDARYIGVTANYWFTYRPGEYTGARHKLSFLQGLFVCLYDATGGRIRYVWPSFRIKVDK